MENTIVRPSNFKACYCTNERVVKVPDRHYPPIPDAQSAQPSVRSPKRGIAIEFQKNKKGQETELGLMWDEKKK